MVGSVAHANSVNRPTKIVMDPEDPNYSENTIALLKSNGVDVYTDPFFHEESVEVIFSFFCVGKI